MRQLTVRIEPWQKRQLRKLRDRSQSARLVKRAICVLRSAAGESARVIARVAGLSPDAVTDIRRRWQRQGLASLCDRRHPGRPPRVTAAYRRQLRAALRSGPLRFGYAFTVWSIARLRTHLARRTGITISTDWLRRLAHAQGFVVARPKHTLKGKRDERQYRKTAQRLTRLKKGRCSRAHLTSCGTPTPPHSSCCRISRGAGCSKDVSRR